MSKRCPAAVQEHGLNKVGIIAHILSVITLITLISGCTTDTSPSCRARVTSDWANTTDLKSDINQLTSPALQGRKTGTRGAKLSREFISQRFAQIGLTPWLPSSESDDVVDYAIPFTYDYQFSQRQGINLVGVLKSPTPSSRWRIVIAHYDHLGKKAGKVHPGADDNASGVAAMLQIAAQSAATQDNTERANLMFVATDAEEQGLFGGYALVERLNNPASIPTSEQIELAINLDMIGRPGRPYAIYLEGKRGFKNFNQIRQRITAENSLCIKANHPGALGRELKRVDWLRASDHYPLHKAGIPWLYFGVPPHRDYHAPTDTTEKIDLKFLAAVTESAYQLLIINSLLLQNTPQSQ
ncbi:M28 family peptidase [Shewanella canadensis]|uniref:M28 family peptidase n=1 Tax=Shewanella canadensis TaxID=271096 RepID=A0A3S0K858_9GAMM|nr:M28 family peptidase [Shewanella canadensis]RTR37710.1 M28 family peptidase [Shewanella canadensis]